MELLDIQALESLPKTKQINYKKEIVNGNDLESIPIIYLPTPVSEEYYFISYSHKNYKEVYSDLFDLELIGFPFWYDRGIPAGSNWKDIAIKYLEPFDCKGVVFYISEDALLSDAISKEISFTLENEKSFLVIYLGKDTTLTAMIKRLFKEKKITKEKYDFFLDVFSEDVIYLKYQEPAETKKEKILNSLPKQKLLSLQVDEEGNQVSEILDFDVAEPVTENNEKVSYVTLKEIKLYVDGSNNYYLKEIKANDFVDTLSLLHDEKYLDYEDYSSKLKFVKALPSFKDIGLRCIIDRFSFANLKYLESVELPSNIEIGECAFGRTKNLIDVRFVDFGKLDRDIRIGDYAFNGCERLDHFDFSHVSIIGEGAFRNCYSLKSVKLGENYTSKEIPFSAFENCIKLNKVELNNDIEVIGESAFYLAPIESIVLPKNLKEIRSYAFSFTHLASITFNDSLEDIYSHAFFYAGCMNRLELVLPGSLKHIGEGAFSFSSVKKITFKGTYARFMEIAKECVREKQKGDDVTDILELVCEDKKTVVALIDNDEYYVPEFSV